VLTDARLLLVVVEHSQKVIDNMIRIKRRSSVGCHIPKVTFQGEKFLIKMRFVVLFAFVAVVLPFTFAFFAGKNVANNKGRIKILE
jgi:hypothetical protein